MHKIKRRTAPINIQGLVFNAIHQLACEIKYGVMFETTERISLSMLIFVLLLQQRKSQLRASTRQQTELKSGELLQMQKMDLSRI